MLNTQEDTFSISTKVQKMVDAYIDDKIQSEMKNYEEYKKVYEHILKLPMISQKVENSGSKVNMYMTKKIVELTKEVSTLNKELELLKQKLSFYENTEQNQNIHLEIKEANTNMTPFINNSLSSSNIYNELIKTGENVVKKDEGDSSYHFCGVEDNQIKIGTTMALNQNLDIKEIEFVTPLNKEITEDVQYKDPIVVGDISPRCWSLHNSYKDLKEEQDDEKSNHTDLESEIHEIDGPEFDEHLTWLEEIGRDDVSACPEDENHEENEENEENEEEEEVEEMEIEGSVYYVTDKVDGIIYEMLPEEDVGDKLGEIKGGKAFFY